MLKHLYSEHEEVEICCAAVLVQWQESGAAVMGMAGEGLPTKATSPALQLLSVLNAPTSPVHFLALPAALGSGSTRATGVSLS